MIQNSIQTFSPMWGKMRKVKHHPDTILRELRDSPAAEHPFVSLSVSAGPRESHLTRKAWSSLLCTAIFLYLIIPSPLMITAPSCSSREGLWFQFTHGWTHSSFWRSDSTLHFIKSQSGLKMKKKKNGIQFHFFLLLKQRNKSDRY